MSPALDSARSYATLIYAATDTAAPTPKERVLWLTIISHAVEDFKSGNEHWRYFSSPSFHMVCTLAGVYPHQVREALRPHVERNQAAIERRKLSATEKGEARAKRRRLNVIAPKGDA